MPPSALKPEAAIRKGTQGPLGRPLSFQWNLLAWAALVGTLTGFTIVGFHLLLDAINTFLYGPFVEGLLEIARSPIATAAPTPAVAQPPLSTASATPCSRCCNSAWMASAS